MVSYVSFFVGFSSLFDWPCSIDIKSKTLRAGFLKSQEVSLLKTFVEFQYLLFGLLNRNILYLQSTPYDLTYIACFPADLIHLCQMHLFFISWKHQKTLRFSGGRERVHWKTNGLIYLYKAVLKRKVNNIAIGLL